MKRGNYVLTVLAVVAIIISVFALLVSMNVVNFSSEGITGNAINAISLFGSKKCVDSDKGLNLSVKGIVTGVSGNKWSDSCMQGTVSGVASCAGSDCFVTEVVCGYIAGSEKIEEGVYYKSFNCANGCKNGACSAVAQVASTTTTNTATATATSTAVSTTPIANPYGPRGPRNYVLNDWLKTNGPVKRIVEKTPGGPLSKIYNNVPRHTKIQDAINAAVAGDVIVVANGDYDENLNVNKKVTLVSETKGGAKIYGRHFFSGILIKGFYISLRKLPTQTCFGVCSSDGKLAGLEMLSGTAEDIIAYKNNGGGIGFRGDGVVVRNSLMQENTRSGLIGYAFTGVSGFKNVQLLDSLLVGNNIWSYDAGHDGGGGKFIGTDKLLVRNVEAYGNKGPGIWVDYENTNFDVSYNYVHDNNVGMAIEVSGRTGKGKVHHNTIGKNIDLGGSGVGQGLGIWESINVEVTDNIFEGPTYLGGLTVRNMRTRSPYYLYGLVVKNNRFRNGATIGTANQLTDSEFRAGKYSTNPCSHLNCTKWDNEGKCLQWVYGGDYKYGCNINRCVQNNSGLSSEWDNLC